MIRMRPRAHHKRMRARIKHNPRVGHGRWKKGCRPQDTRIFGARVPPRKPWRLADAMWERRIASFRRVGNVRPTIIADNGNDDRDGQFILLLGRGTKRDFRVVWTRVITKGQFKSGWKRKTKR